ncbi:hypothetical protein NLX83_22940 [Allokutzneria sp. A3M-2-11 16]|uniref:hypothetical protein n=1 Tax=Allokutzneria sp. A3M-2-11 16 TaxID=2962043 RepID=UPI0020B7EFF4|nr:hypothetical protein [Allokutzneria sp. A3M-2-11 16]MCP3802127.1 hypothetical protein [Allokutzneria sp. A3M-2-11 16]
MTSYTVEYLPVARKTLDSVSTSMRAEIKHKVSRYATFAPNFSGGRHQRYEVKGTGFVAECLIRHDAGRLTVVKIKVHVL